LLVIFRDEYPVGTEMEYKADLIVTTPAIVRAYGDAVNAVVRRGWLKQPRTGNPRLMINWIRDVTREWRLLLSDEDRKRRTFMDMGGIVFPSSHRQILDLLGRFLMEGLGVGYFYYRRSTGLIQKIREVRECATNAGFTALEVFLKEKLAGETDGD
jgi:hypothetical protein